MKPKDNRRTLSVEFEYRETKAKNGINIFKNFWNQSNLIKKISQE